MRARKEPIGLGAGLAGICLAIVVAWALAAVLMLTGTLTSATQINDRVKVINSALTPINYNLSFVKLAGNIGMLTKKIDAAAEPLSGQANQVLGAARSIDSKVGPILKNAEAINGVVRAINATAASINTTVHGIGGSVSSIGSSVQSIGSSVSGIGGAVGSIQGKVTSILGAVGSPGATGSIDGAVSQIEPRFGSILTTVRQIKTRVEGINRRADAILSVAGPIKVDFDGILGGVGTTVHTDTVLGHANSIDCSKLFNNNPLAMGPSIACVP